MRVGHAKCDKFSINDARFRAGPRTVLSITAGISLGFIII